MIQITPQMRIWLAVKPVDFRCGIDGLLGICRSRLGVEPFSGAVFVFRNRTRTSIKIIVYDGQGFWLCQKRLSAARFTFWPDGEAPIKTLQACELQVLIMGGDPAQIHAAPNWRQLNTQA